MSKINATFYGPPAIHVFGLLFSFLFLNFNRLFYFNTYLNKSRLFSIKYVQHVVEKKKNKPAYYHHYIGALSLSLTCTSYLR